MKKRFTRMDAVLIMYFALAILLFTICSCSGSRKVAVTKVDKCPNWVSKQ